ncbi:DapH/DapD/GlmU-related protein [Noviherbaspirillum pedocola]|uniref:Uncharacterized protein n=1 Tax=Noviherbaspirillum pedocola TaxID=2801341 RepID=A0A934SQ05_9BURK|nr:DapH/DapD/GlmU-related protein [Noviherbaspirillum pedocola]MBK4733354.1 hypothetical protein [Noviherbaspirillum pedocola]
MLSATAFLADGLDLVVEFLARAEADAGAMRARYASVAALAQAAQEMTRWAQGSTHAGTLRADADALALAVSQDLWQDLYARVLFAGRPVPPDRIGLNVRGAGGMLAALELVLEYAGHACSHSAMAWKDHPALRDAQGAPIAVDLAPQAFVAAPWQPLRELFLRHAQLRLTIPQVACAGRGAQAPDAFLFTPPGGAALLICRPSWYEQQWQTLRQHFLEHALLLFRLLFADGAGGWGLDPDSRLLWGFANLLEHSEGIGFVAFGDFGDACADMARLQEARPSQELRGHLHAAVRDLARIWPANYPAQSATLRAMYAGWMVRVHARAHVGAGVVLEPGVRLLANAVVEAGAVVRIGARIGAGVHVPRGVVIGRQARVMRLDVHGAALPAGTVLHGDVRLRPHAWIQRHVEIGHDVEIGPGVVIREGMHIADHARITHCRVGDKVRLWRGTIVEGNLDIEDGVRIGPDVSFANGVRVRTGAVLGPGIRVPEHTIVVAGARIDCIRRGAASIFEPDVVLHGNVDIGAGAVIGANAVLGPDVRIGPGVHLPPGIQVEAGACIDVLRLHGNVLPRSCSLAGSLEIGERCGILRDIRFGAGVEIAAGISLPAGVIIADGARIDTLALRGASLPAGTTLEGDLHFERGVRVGRAVRFGAGVRIARNVVVPDAVSIAPLARISRLHIARGALPFGARLYGNLHLGEGVVVGRDVEFHAGVEIGCACAIPDGLVFAPDAQITQFSIAPDVTLPPGSIVAGNLRLEAGVTVGAEVRFGARVHVGRGVAIPNGAELAPDACITQLEIGAGVALPQHFVLAGDVSIGADACIGEGAILGADCVIGAGVEIPPGAVVAPGARIERLRIAPDTLLPPQTAIGGNLVIGREVQVGVGISFGDGVRIAPHVRLPSGLVIVSGATIRHLHVPPGVLRQGTMVDGDLTVAAGADIGDDVYFGAGVTVGAGARIAAGVAVPAGSRVGAGARIELLDIGADVAWPAQATIGGDLVVGAAAVIGENVRLGARVRIGAGAVIGAGAAIGDDAVIAPGSIVEPGCMVPAGAQWQMRSPAPTWPPQFGAALSAEPGNPAGSDIPVRDVLLEAWADELGLTPDLLPIGVEPPAAPLEAGTDYQGAPAAPVPLAGEPPVAPEPTTPRAIPARMPLPSPWRL